MLGVAMDEEEARDEDRATLGGATPGILVARVDFSDVLTEALRFFL